ncbi:MAG: hypothetical protein ACK4S4_07370 [Pyrinomonadaceae bacterium]
MQGLFDNEDANDAAGQTAREPQAAALADPYPELSQPEGSIDTPPVMTAFEPESTAVNIRRFGLAWSAGMAFFGAIVFMLFIGWMADLILGSSPWGVIGGIVLGSIIGFLQFFRITSQIFRPKAADSLPLRPLHVADEPGTGETKLPE